MIVLVIFPYQNFSKSSDFVMQIFFLAYLDADDD